MTECWLNSESTTLQSDEHKEKFWYLLDYEKNSKQETKLLHIIKFQYQEQTMTKKHCLWLKAINTNATKAELA